MKRKKALVFGAGSIGRGFIGELMHLSGFDITFADVDHALIDAVNENGSYTLEIVSNEQKQVKEIPVRAMIDGSDEQKTAQAVAAADIIFTAVGQSALKYIAKPVAMGIGQRKETVNIILCENMMDAGIAFKEMTRKHLDDIGALPNVGFLRASVGRMVPQTSSQSSLPTVKAEPYYHLPVDADGIVGTLPGFWGCEKVSPFDFAMERKLFIHNLGHAACAWLGAFKNYTYIYEAVADIDIRLTAQSAMAEAAAGLSKKYDKDIMELYAHIEDLLHRFENIALGDTVSRVGRDTLRKLSANDRAVGALILCTERGLPCDNIKKIIAAGVKFENDDEDTNNVQRMRKEYGAKKVLEDVCGIESASLQSEILKHIEG